MSAPATSTPSLYSQISSAITPVTGGEGATPAPSPSPTPASAPSETPPATPATPPAASPTPATPPTPASEPPAEGASPEPELGEEDFQFSDERPAAPKPAAPAGEPEVSPDEEYAGERMPVEEVKKLERAFTRTNRGRRALSALKMSQELEKDPTQGGIGFTPTAPQVKEFFQDSSDLRVLGEEFHSGHPEQASNWISQWFAPDGPDQISPGAKAVAEQLLPTLSEKAPQLATTISLQAVDNYRTELLNYARSRGDKQERLYWASVALAIEHHLSGKEFSPQELADLQKELEGAPAAKPDPRSAEIDAKLARIDKFEKGRAQEAQQNFVRSLGKEITTGVMADISEALTKIKETLPGSFYDALTKRFLSEVEEKVSQNTPGMREYQSLREKAWRSRSPADIQAAARAWRNLARPIIRSLRLPYLRDASVLQRTKSEERHQVAQEAAGRTGTTSLAQPAPQSVLPQDAMKRKEGETSAQHLHRLTRESFQRSGLLP